MTHTDVLNICQQRASSLKIIHHPEELLEEPDWRLHILV